MSSNGDASQLPPPPPSSPPPPKKNMGRRKLPMKKMENATNLQVTFSKRRAGLFKKASEFCTLTGSEAGVVVFSPANKPFAFGHPNIYTIMDRYLEDPMNAGGSSNNAMDPELQANLDELMRMESLLEGEKAQRKELEKERKKMVEEKVLVTPSMVGSMNDLEELMKLRDSIFKLKSGIEAHVLQKQSADQADRGKGLKGAEVIPYVKEEMGSNGGGGGQAKDGKNAAEVKVDRLDDGLARRFF